MFLCLIQRCMPAMSLLLKSMKIKVSTSSTLLRKRSAAFNTCDTCFHPAGPLSKSDAIQEVVSNILQYTQRHNNANIKYILPVAVKLFPSI